MDTNTKFTTPESTFKLEQARGGNLFNKNGATPEAMMLMERMHSPIIGFIQEQSTGDRLTKVFGCQVIATSSHWLFTLAEEAAHCKTNVPYLFTVEKVFFNRDETPGLRVKPVVELSPDLLRNERFGNLIVNSGKFPMHWPTSSFNEWDYEPLRKHFGLSENTSITDLCKYAVDQAISGNTSFEKVVELIHLPKSLLTGLFGGAEAVKSGTHNFRSTELVNGKNKPKRKRTCKGKKYKEPRQKVASTSSASNASGNGKSNKNKDSGKKKGK